MFDIFEYSKAETIVQHPSKIMEGNLVTPLNPILCPFYSLKNDKRINKLAIFIS